MGCVSDLQVSEEWTLYKANNQAILKSAYIIHPQNCFQHSVFLLVGESGGVLGSEELHECGETPLHLEPQVDSAVLEQETDGSQRRREHREIGVTKKLHSGYRSRNMELYTHAKCCHGSASEPIVRHRTRWLKL